MNSEAEICKEIAAREIASRKEAELRLESKSRELSEKNRELEAVAKRMSAANSLLSEIMAVAPNGILLCSADFTVTEINPACLRKIGYSESEVIGRNIDRFFPEISACLKSLNGEFFLEKLKASRKKSEAFTVEIRGFAGEIGTEFRYLLFVHDITKRLQREDRRKQIEQTIDEARRLEAIGALSAGIAHEINTPIQFIGDNLDYLQEALKKIRKSYDGFDMLRAAAERQGDYAAELKTINETNASINLLSLIPEIASALEESREGIRQVRDIVLLMKEFAHPGSGEKHEADINKIVENVVKLSKNRQKRVAEVQLDLAGSLPKINCRRGQMQQVILNIVINALDALEEAKTAEGRVRIQTSYDDEWVKVAISDNGPGVPASLREKIFDPFFTTKPVGKGTGQGLALAKDCVVKGHDGRLTLGEVEGFASTFLIEIPRNPRKTQYGKERDDAFAA